MNPFHLYSELYLNCLVNQKTIVGILTRWLKWNLWFLCRVRGHFLYPSVFSDRTNRDNFYLYFLFYVSYKKILTLNLIKNYGVLVDFVKKV